MLREKCLYSEFFWSVFSHIHTEYGEIRTRKTLNMDTFHAVQCLLISVAASTVTSFAQLSTSILVNDGKLVLALHMLILETSVLLLRLYILLHEI